MKKSVLGCTYSFLSEQLSGQMKEEVVDSLFVTWLTLLGIAYLSLALPHCALNSPTFVPLLGEMINHLRTANAPSNSRTSPSRLPHGEEVPAHSMSDSLLWIQLGPILLLPCGFGIGIYPADSCPDTSAIRSALAMPILFCFVQFIQLTGNSSQVGCFLLSGF